MLRCSSSAALRSASFSAGSIRQVSVLVFPVAIGSLHAAFAMRMYYMGTLPRRRKWLSHQAEGPELMADRSKPGGGIVGDPSAKKSPAWGAGLKPLDRLIAEALESHRTQLADYETSKVVFDAQKDAIQGRIKAKKSAP